MKKSLVISLVLFLSLFLSFSVKIKVNADGNHGPGFYFEDDWGGGDGGTGEPPVSEDIELIATGFLQEMYHYDQYGHITNAPYYNNGQLQYGLQMELYLRLDDIDDKFVDIDGITQFYARFTNSYLEYYNNIFYRVIYVTDINA
ncbi:MAG: hypothetical protein WC907_05420, partial [Acholeplasmataceae bacterium]